MLWDIITLLVLAGTVALLVCVDLPGGLENLLATLVGVFVGVRLEHWVGVQRDRQEARTSRRLLRDELKANLDAAEEIAVEEKDYPAVVAAVLDIKIGFWTAMSKGGRLQLVGDLNLLRSLDRAYSALEDLRVIADLFFRDAKWVVSTHGAGLNQTFDLKRKQRARDAVTAIEAAISALESQGISQSST